MRATQFFCRISSEQNKLINTKYVREVMIKSEKIIITKPHKEPKLGKTFFDYLTTILSISLKISF